MNCKQCGEPLPEIERGNGGHRPREYCDRACRQKYYREHIPVHTQMLINKIREVEALREQVAQLEQENAQLRNRLDYERRYLSDITPRYFRAWLRKQPTSPWRTAFLSDQLVPARGPRSLYEAHVRRLHLSEEEHEDFVRLWKLMLLQS